MSVTRRLLGSISVKRQLQVLNANAEFRMCIAITDLATYSYRECDVPPWCRPTRTQERKRASGNGVRILSLQLYPQCLCPI